MRTLISRTVHLIGISPNTIFMHDLTQSKINKLPKRDFRNVPLTESESISEGSGYSKPPLGLRIGRSGLATFGPDWTKSNSVRPGPIFKGPKGFGPISV